MGIFLCWFCDLVGSVVGILPSTPQEFTIGGLIVAAGNQFPFVGSGILFEVYTGVQSLFLVFLIIKAARIVQYFKFW